ncbi:hypothetical protein GGU11DRAFT_750719 [Lentinula aff. detonsa]|nr:hypothetical protein GGU11DRAFT_750719 [Lentinula aff. detonsa]
MSLGSDHQDFLQYALSLPNNISDDSSHGSEPHGPHNASDSEAQSDISDVESNVSANYSDTSDVYNWDEILHRADPRYRHRFLRHMMDYYTNPDSYTGPYDYSDSEFNYSHDSLVNSTHSSNSFYSAHSSVADPNWVNLCMIMAPERVRNPPITWAQMVGSSNLSENVAATCHFVFTVVEIIFAVIAPSFGRNMEAIPMVRKLMLPIRAPIRMPI